MKPYNQIAESAVQTDAPAPIRLESVPNPAYDPTQAGGIPAADAFSGAPARAQRKLRVLMLLVGRDIGDGRVRRQAEAIAAAGHSITVLSQWKRCYGLDRHEVDEGVLYWRTKYRRVKVPFVRLPMTVRLGHWANRMVKDIEPDIIHAHDLPTLPIAVRLARRCGACIVYDSHELNSERVGGWSERDRRYLRWRESRYIHKADAVITVSEGVAGHLCKLHGIEPPTLVMNAPAIREVGHGGSVAASLRGSLGLGHDVGLGVYTGGRNRFRGIEKVVRALGRVPDMHLAMVGRGAGDTDDYLSGMAESGGYGHRLHLLPPVPHDLVTQYIASADFGVIPYCDPCLNYQYAMPNKLFEAVFAGLPVAVSDVPDMKRFVESNDVGMVMNMHDEESVVATLKALTDRRSELRLGESNVASLMREYGWQAQAHRLLAVYDRIVSQSAHRDTTG